MTYKRIANKIKTRIKELQEQEEKLNAMYGFLDDRAVEKRTCIAILKELLI